MYCLKMGVLFLVPTVMLLTVSFFVLFAVGKVEEKNLKIFGRIVAILLWIVAACVLFSGIYFSFNKGQHGRMGMKDSGKCQMMNKMMDAPDMEQHMRMMQEKMKMMPHGK